MISSKNGNILEADNLYFSYHGATPLFTGFNMSVRSGERLALVGQSGLGKSTLCQLLAGYLRPQGGSVLLNRQGLPKRGVCPVQMVWQHPVQAADPRMRMRDMLAEAGLLVGGAGFLESRGSRGSRDGRGMFGSEIASDGALLLEQLGIRKEWLGRYPHELSGGELQRFCLARALATGPQFLIADEISTMLDALTQAVLWKVIIELQEQQGFGIVFVSHSPALVRRLATDAVYL